MLAEGGCKSVELCVARRSSDWSTQIKHHFRVGVHLGERFLVGSPPTAKPQTGRFDNHQPSS
jgi:hypothetical protein